MSEDVKSKTPTAAELDAEVGDISADEEREAAELVRLLAGRATVNLSSDTMDGVGLLRLAHDVELSPEAFARIEADLLAGKTDAREAEPSVSWRKVWWWLLAAVAPATAALFLVLSETSAPNTASRGAVQLPAPDVEVLEAQASWITSDAQRPTFEREMRDYRAQVLASLDAR